MITREQALADQERLARLCAPRVVKHPEIYWPNSNYGCAGILKTYAELPPGAPLWALVPHGVYLNDSALFEGEATAPVPAVLSFPAYRDEVWANHSDKLVIPSAAPFVYALEIMKSHGWALPSEREGTIVFPMHSTAVTDTNTRWSRLADELAALPEVYQPVTVCLHWQDLERKRDAEFVRRGMRVVSAGHFTNQEFVYRMVHLMSEHRFAASNGVGSNLFYAVWMGMPYFLVGREPGSVLVKGNEHLRGQFATNSDTTARRTASVRALFEPPATTDPVLVPTDEQRKMAAEYLGVERFRSPAELRADIEAAGAARR